MPNFENEKYVTGSECMLRAILQDLIGQHQYQLPVQLLITGSDGGLQFAIIDDQESQPTLMAQHLPHGEIIAPAHWILIDAAGRPAHYLLWASPAAFVDLRSVHANLPTLQLIHRNRQRIPRNPHEPDLRSRVPVAHLLDRHWIQSQPHSNAL